MAQTLLHIENLSLAIGKADILSHVDMRIDRGEVLGLVGESGSGKSMTALAIMQLLPHAAHASGRILFDGADLLTRTEDQMCALRGDDIGMVFQEPMTALNPVKTIGEQVAEGIRWHTRCSRAEAEERTRAILDRVGLPQSRFPLSRFPHELSGGQRQRVVIAIACALKPRLLIADEPTTALDVVLQAQILDLLRDLVEENRMGLLLISHDLAVVADMADRLVVMRHGKVMEQGETASTLKRQEHPYTRQLAEASMHVPAARQAAPARPRTDDAGGNASPETPPLLAVDKVVRDYAGRRTSLFSRPAPFRAVDDVSFSMEPGHSVALVGRSGCGKSTLARMILALDQPTGGAIRLAGQDLSHLEGEALRPFRRRMQVVFQDPYGSFNPRHKVERLVAEPLHLLDSQPSRSERRERVAEALAEVHMPPDSMDRYPHEFSGGQRQRISIARAVITRPDLIVADEPVSALDVSIRAQILDLFAELNGKLRLAYLFITHDLTVARAITDEVMVMHEGRIVERGSTADVLSAPRHEATRALVDAAPDLERAIARRLSRA
ncbi:microcin ABC transporter ATP-binding protein [Zhengella mangrovi]|uniref:Microcin ABC transporter ATP-binding protein n=1 Tax=Zhengella mangrovi TaxID=1982044 RepID=A0A2G1QPR7_9HYPH|nr:dipeptide ABC transporter ATP-binding protein [Zhengella mangrovi]PHP67485.1 microcin ABC transporter ATP-binding protein [Zhengella mangrovi]